MKERQYGLDLYRIMAMLMITALHINFQHCNLLNRHISPVGLYYAGLIIEYVCFAGVNCFAMLSGFLMGSNTGGYDRHWGYRSSSFLLKMVFWGILLYLLVYFCFPGGREYDFDMRKTVFPFIGFWWYISAYCGVLIFMPLLNTALSKFSKRDYIVLSAVMLAVFSAIPTYYDNNSGNMILANGYSTIWLIICFIFGAAIKKLLPEILQIKRITLILILLLLSSVAVPLAVELLAGKRYMEYTTPFCVLEAACLLILCSRIKIVDPLWIKIISFISVNSLGIYLVQNYPYFWEKYIIRLNPPVYEPLKYLWYLPGVILALMIIGVFGNFAVDKIYRIAGVDRLLRKIFAIKR